MVRYRTGILVQLLLLHVGVHKLLVVSTVLNEMVLYFLERGLGLILLNICIYVLEPYLVYHVRSNFLHETRKQNTLLQVLLTTHTCSLNHIYLSCMCLSGCEGGLEDVVMTTVANDLQVTIA